MRKRNGKKSGKRKKSLKKKSGENLNVDEGISLFPKKFLATLYVDFKAHVYKVVITPLLD
ncbi:MAG: hypothetical protein ACP5ER_00805 [Candidatus Bathyarchaeales archaeon]